MDDAKTCPRCGTRFDTGARFCTVDGTALGVYAPAPAPPPRPPRGTGSLVADRYRVGRVVGQGGLGIVYEAIDEATGRRVALKLLRELHGEESTARLLAEARTIRRLTHPNIVGVQDAGTLPGGGAFLTLDWVEGRSLRDVLAMRTIALAPSDALDVAIAIAGALVAAHAHGVLHRDVTPNNVLLPRDASGADDFAHAMLADFGVHGLLTERAADGQLTTQAGMIVGTPRYMAPEQLLGARNTAATDLFGLGAVLFEMLYRRSPFGDSLQSVIVAQLRAPLEIPAEPVLDPDLTVLLGRLLDREPTQRPQRAEDVLAMLRGIRVAMEFRRGATSAFVVKPPFRLREKESVPEAPVPAAERPPSAVMPPTGPVRQPPSPSHSRAMPGALGAVVVGSLVLVGALAYAVWQTRTGARVIVPAAWRAVAQAIVVIGVGGLVFALVSRLIAHRHAVLAAQTADLTQSVDAALFGTMPLDRDGISQTIVTTVEAIIQRCKSLDERLIGQTIVAIAHEYASDASTPDSRMQALVQIPQQIEKLSARIAARSTPWYVRHDKLLAAAVSGTAVIGGLAKTMIDVVAATHGGTH